MNKRILELRTQAAAWVAENHQPQDPNAYSQKEIDQRYLMYEEKFAELIVRECIRCCEDVDVIQKHYLKYGIDQELGAGHCIEVIKKHFGIDN